MAKKWDSDLDGVRFQQIMDDVKEKVGKRNTKNETPACCPQPSAGLIQCTTFTDSLKSTLIFTGPFAWAQFLNWFLLVFHSEEREKAMK